MTIETTIMGANPIADFLHQQQNKKLSVSALINAHARLSMTQIRKGCVSYEDILQTLKLTLEGKTGESGERLEGDIDAYGALLYSSVLAPSFSASTMNKPSLVMKADIVGNEGSFIHALHKELKDQNGGNTQNPVIAAFEKDSTTYLTSIGVTPNFEPTPVVVPTDQSLASGKTSPVTSPPRSINASPNSMKPTPTSFPALEADHFLPKAAENDFQGSGSSDDFDFDFDNQSTPPDSAHDGTTSTETNSRHDPVSQFLSQIRRYGMVILLPQTLHDQVRLLIYFSGDFSLIFLVLLDFGLLLCYPPPTGSSYGSS
jgi:hypothetical protein